MTAPNIHMSPILKSRSRRTLRYDLLIITKTPTVEINRPNSWKMFVFSNLNIKQNRMITGGIAVFNKVTFVTWVYFKDI